MSELIRGRSLNFNQLQQLTSRQADYEWEQADPVLRAGMITEAADLMLEPTMDDRSARNRLRGDLGGVLWYASEISRHYDTAPDVLTQGSESLEDFQRYPTVRRPITQIFDNYGHNLNGLARAADLIPVYALRVTDVIEPQTDELWLPDSQRIDLAYALGDLMIGTGIAARRAGITLSSIAWQTYDSLEAQRNNSNIYTEPVNYHTRIYADPWVQDVVRQVTLDNAELLISDPTADYILP